MRSTTAGGASAGARPVMASMARPDASPSRQPRPPQKQGRPPGLDDDVADVAGVAGLPVEQAPVEHDPASDPGRNDHPDDRPLPRRRLRPTPRPGRRPWRRCRRRPRRPVASAIRRRSGKPRQAGMWTGVSSSPPAVIGPAGADAAHLGGRPVRPELVEQADQGAEDDLGVVGAGRGDGRPGEDPPVGASTRPAASFVPPMSTASTVTPMPGTCLESGARPGGGSVRSRAVAGQPRGGRAVRVVGAPGHRLVDGGRDRLPGPRRRALSPGGLDRAGGGHRVRMARLSENDPRRPAGRDEPLDGLGRSRRSAGSSSPPRRRSPGPAHSPIIPVAITVVISTAIRFDLARSLAMAGAMAGIAGGGHPLGAPSRRCRGANGCGTPPGGRG